MTFHPFDRWVFPCFQEERPVKQVSLFRWVVWEQAGRDEEAVLISPLAFRIRRRIYREQNWLFWAQGVPGAGGEIWLEARVRQSHWYSLKILTKKTIHKEQSRSLTDHHLMYSSPTKNWNNSAWSTEVCNQLSWEAADAEHQGSCHHPKTSALLETKWLKEDIEKILTVVFLLSHNWWL